MKELATARQARDMGELPGQGYEWRPEAAERVKTFIERYCKHYKGEWAGQPFILQDWQWEDIILPVFGWYRPDGTRRFREAYIEVPRKNGKTLLAAAVGLYLFIADREPGAQVYSAATKKDQAKLVWEDATQMVKMAPALRDIVTIRRSNMSITETASKFEPLGADSNTLDGLNPHAVLIDELHAHRDRRVYDVLTTAYGSRRNPLTFIITTAGLYDPESIGWQKHEHARKVLEGSVEDDEFFAYVACAEAEDDPFEESTWEKANPNYGVSVKPAYIQTQMTKARKQPSAYNSVVRYHLGIWPQSQSRWLDADVWKSCGDWQADREELEGQVCYGGLDMSTTTDLTAFVLVFPDEWKVLTWLWCPRDTIQQRSVEDAVPYDMWADDGILQDTSGNAVDYDTVRDTIVALGDRYALQEVWYDPWNAAQMAQELAETHGIETVMCRQGYSGLNGPSKAFERLLYAGDLQHGDNPALNWMASHITVKEDPAGNIKPDKKASNERIDGLVALIMAIGAATTADEDMSSIYEDDDPIVVSLA